MLKTFTGFSEDGLDLAVKDAYQDLEKFLGQGIDGLVTKPVSTTSNVVYHRDEATTEYWFTLTVIID